MTAPKTAAALIARLADARAELDDALFGIEHANDAIELAGVTEFAAELRAEVKQLAAQLDELNRETRAAKLVVKPSQSELSRSQRNRVLGALRSIRTAVAKVRPSREIAAIGREAVRTISRVDSELWGDAAAEDALRIARNARDLNDYFSEIQSALAQESRNVPCDVDINVWREQLRVRLVRAGLRDPGPEKPRPQRVFSAPRELM